MRMYVFRRYAAEQYVFSNICLHFSKFISLHLFIYLFFLRKERKRENILHYFRRKVSLRNIQFLQAAFLPSNQIICNLANKYIHISIYLHIITDWGQYFYLFSIHYHFSTITEAYRLYYQCISQNFLKHYIFFSITTCVIIDKRTKKWNGNIFQMFQIKYMK